jgi:hypothetical protein
MTTKPSPEKKADSLIALFQGCFERRKELETIQWKVNFSAWTSIGLAGWAIHSKPEHLGRWGWVFLLSVPVHAYVTRRFRVCIRNAVNLGLKWVDDLGTLIDHQHHIPHNTGGWSWYIVAIAPTAMLAIAAALLVQ